MNVGFLVLTFYPEKRVISFQTTVKYSGRAEASGKRGQFRSAGQWSAGKLICSMKGRTPAEGFFQRKPKKKRRKPALKGHSSHLTPEEKKRKRRDIMLPGVSV